MQNLLAQIFVLWLSQVHREKKELVIGHLNLANA